MLNNHNHPFIISFEGMDRSGKSTQAKSLYNRLELENYNVVLIRSPSDTDFGKYIKSIKTSLKSPEAVLLIHVADFFEEQVKYNKDILIYDRYLDSCFASMLYFGLQKEWINKVVSILPQPNLMIYMFVSLTGIKNRPKLDMGDNDYAWQRAKENYYNSIKGRSNVLIVSGEKSIEDIANEVYNEFKKLLV